MGVMPCKRKECENVLCDTYVDGIGYICNSCKEEFEEFLSYNLRNPQTQGEFLEDLRSFMATEKGNIKPISNVKEFFKNYTRE